MCFNKNLLWAVAVCLVMPTLASINVAHAETATINEELFRAVSEGNLEGVKNALDKGASLTAISPELEVPVLCYAASQGNLEIVKLLIEKGANVNYATEYGVPPIVFAVEHGDNVEIVKALVEAGSDVNLGEGGNTTLDMIIEYFADTPRLKSIAYLESKGAVRGETPTLTEEEMKNLPSDTPSEAIQTANSQPADATGQLTFKGLRLGMTVEEAALKMLENGVPPGDGITKAYLEDRLRAYVNKQQQEVDRAELNSKIGPDGNVLYKFGGPWNGKDPLKLREDFDGTVLSGPGWTIRIDENKVVDKISLYPGCVDKLFNSETFGPDEFIQRFMEAYGIPEMDISLSESSVNAFTFNAKWSYVDRENGWGIAISEYKAIDVVRIAKESETSFN